MKGRAIYQEMKKHLLFDAFLVCICIGTMIGVRDYYEGQLIYARLFSLYLLCTPIILVHQVVYTFISIERGTGFLFFFSAILYFLLAVAGLYPFVVRSLAW